jgi:poly(hydroxyalkanoate) granule-associated protein
LAAETKKRMVMPKRLKELADEATENENQLTQLGVKIRESANQIWLAGLGAFSKAQQEGTKMFETLVEEGEKVQERTKVAVDERLGEMRGAWDKLSLNKLEKVFEDRVGRALHALNVPTHMDIDVLSKQVHELTVITKKMSEEEETHGRGRAHRAKAE